MWPCFTQRLDIEELPARGLCGGAPVADQLRSASPLRFGTRRLRADVGELHVAAIGSVLPDEERLERGHDLPVERALFVGLHVRRVVPETYREPRILVFRILGEPPTAQSFEALALREYVLPVSTLELAPRPRPKLSPGDANDHGGLLIKGTAGMIVERSALAPTPSR